MKMPYHKLLSGNLPAPVDSPAGAEADTKYVFSVTYADAQSLPSEGLALAMRDAMRRDGPELAQYPPPQGHEGMREMISQDLANNRSLEVGVDQIYLGAGAGGTIQSIIDLFIDPGDVVLVEEFSYLGTLRMLLERRAQVVHVRTDDQGMNVEALEATVNKWISRGRPPKMIYTISVYQNPMGMTLNLARRRQMLEISRRYEIPIVENESYADFHIDGEPLPPAMMGLHDQDLTIYVGAYTKLLGCGLRLGYGVVPIQVRDKLADMKFGVSPSHLAVMTVHEYLRYHKNEHVERVSMSLRAKRDAMLAALDEYFPTNCSWNRPTGGMMVWVRLPEGADTWATLEKAVEADVKYNPGPVFRADQAGNNYLRLTYSHNTPEEIRDGIAILADVFQREGLFDISI